MTYIKARDGTELFVKSWGEGRPVVLTHGWPLAADMWDAQSMALAKAGYRAIAYDRRGFGRSGQPWNGYDYDTFADDLADVMQETGATQDATIVGFSMGGGEIARYMSRHGGKGVIAAGLVSSVVPYVLKTDDNPDGVPESMLQQITDGIEKDRAHFFRNTFFPQVFGVGLITSPVSDEILDMTTGTALHAGLWPTLFIHGTADNTVPNDASGRPAARGIAQSQLIEYDGEPHGLNVTAGDRLTRDLLTFVSG